MRHWIKYVASSFGYPRPGYDVLPVDLPPSQEGLMLSDYGPLLSHVLTQAQT